MPRAAPLALVLALVLALASAAVAPARADGGDVRRELQRAVALRDPKERILAVESALRGADDGNAAEALLDLVFEPEATQAVLDVGVAALARMKSPAAQDVVTKAMLGQQRFRRVLVAEALGRAPGDIPRLQLETAASAPDPRVRAAALTALGDRREEVCAATFAAALEDADWTVRSAAIRGLRLLGGPRAAELLSDRRRREDGRLLDDLADALRDTGPPPRRDPAATAPAWQEPPVSIRSPFFETRTRRVLFVLSTAETMKDPVYGCDADDRVNVTIARAGDDLAKDLAAAKTKLDLARVHLRAMLRSLSEGVAFDVMTYSGSPAFAFGELVAADEATRRKAENRIARLSAGGAPNVHDALHRIFDPRGKDPFDAPDGPDTVVLLSDGALPSNLFRDRAEIAPRAARWNRARQIRFVTIAVGQSEPYLLGTLAGGPPPGVALSIP